MPGSSERFYRASVTNRSLFDSAQMLEQQNTDEWEQGLSNVQLTADGSIINVRSSQLMPVAEEEDEVK